MHEQSHGFLSQPLFNSGWTSLTQVHSDASRELEKEWALLEKAENDPNIVSFDCEAHPRPCKHLDVTSFPTIRLYHRDGRMDRYRGERKAREMGMFIHRALQPFVIETVESTAGALRLLDDVVIMAHPLPDDWSLYERFKALAKQYRDRYSFVVSSPIQDTSALACYNNVDDEKHVTTEVATVQALEDFVKLCSDPLIPELTRQNEVQYTKTGKSILHYFATTEAEKESYRVEMRPLAKKYSEFLHFAITDADDYSDILPAVGLKAGAKTGLALENRNTGDMFPYKRAKKITAKNVEDFLNDIIDGNIKPWNQEAGSGQEGRSHEEL
ncbi:thioredoxin-like domain-containing protein [Lasiosphaeria miniovina]|uniref:Thioredoxin-like domain-containing protein n=1 Tax=Lasiosphaeria miniovina TaxID=1954250 RepID=A0AA40AWJ5_9PEZI|nr:thioredoxin-like domain-containing protein [Lasiosphaeria miniovina]KAK0723297.1 thioredoxin-like domain-containing protein [Lasiosphaeria miniovina]